MAELMIVAGECGRGSSEYYTSLFTLPAGGDRGGETIATVTALVIIGGGCVLTGFASLQ